MFTIGNRGKAALTFSFSGLRFFGNISLFCVFCKTRDTHSTFIHLFTDSLKKSLRIGEKLASPSPCLSIVFRIVCSSTHNGVYIFHRQDRDRPAGIQNPHSEFKFISTTLLWTSAQWTLVVFSIFPFFSAATFQVCIQNRYKLTKKYRKLTDTSLGDPDNLEVKAALAQAKVSRQNGRKYLCFSSTRFFCSCFTDLSHLFWFSSGCRKCREWRQHFGAEKAKWKKGQIWRDHPGKHQKQ